MSNVTQSGYVIWQNEWHLINIIEIIYNIMQAAFNCQWKIISVAMSLILFINSANFSVLNQCRYNKEEAKEEKEVVIDWGSVTVQPAIYQEPKTIHQFNTRIP